MISKENIKPFGKNNKLICKCGNRTKFHIEVIQDDDGARSWIHINCGKCSKGLFYNGA